MKIDKDLSRLIRHGFATPKQLRTEFDASLIFGVCVLLSALCVMIGLLAGVIRVYS